MCDYDGGSYEHIGSALVFTQKRRECNSCLTKWPARTEMTRTVGKTEGDFGIYWTCPVCWWAHEQPDHTDLHLCHGHGWEDGNGYHRTTLASDGEVFAYLRYCFENNEYPTVTQLAGVVHQHRVSDDPDWIWFPSGARTALNDPAEAF